MCVWGGCLYFPSEDVGVEGFNSHTELHSRDMQTQHRVSPPLKGSALGWHNRLSGNSVPVFMGGMVGPKIREHFAPDHIKSARV